MLIVSSETVTRDLGRLKNRSVIQLKLSFVTPLLVIALVFAANFGTASAENVEFLYSFGSEGAEKGQFTIPRGIAVSQNGLVYVTDRGLHRVQAFDASGSFQFQFGLEGTADGRFRGPFDVAVNSINGNVHVADHNNRRVQVFDSSGIFLQSFGDLSTDPRAIGVDDHGNTYVDDGGMISVFDDLGNNVFSFGSDLKTPHGVALDHSGRIYVPEFGVGSRVQIFDSNGVHEFSFGTWGTGSGQFRGPSGVVVDDRGNILVTDADNNRVQVFDQDGNFQYEFGNSGPGMMSRPDGIDVDSTGRIFVVDQGNQRVSVWQAIRDGFPILGDFNDNGMLDAADIDELAMAIKTIDVNPKYDLNLDSLTDEQDHEFWVKELAETFYGDSNLDGEFNSRDLVVVFAAGAYEDSIEANAGWADGDWNGDGDFTTRDLVFAFQDGGYERGPRMVVNAVPEPTSIGSLFTGLVVGIAVFRRRRRS